MSISRRTGAFALATGLTGVVIGLSLGNGLQLPNSFKLFEHIDKLQHCAAYAALGVSWSFAFRQNPRHATWSSISWQRLWVMLFILGALMEVLQYSFYPNRYFEFADMLANGIGAGIGILGFNRIFPTQNLSL